MEVAREETVRGGTVENQGKSPRIVRLSPEARREIRRKWPQEGLSDREAGEVIEFVLEDLKCQADERERKEGKVRETGELERQKEELPKAA